MHLPPHSDVFGAPPDFGLGVYFDTTLIKNEASQEGHGSLLESPPDVPS
jgi:hypothetical protein